MNIDFFWILSLWLLSFLVAILLYFKWTAPILDRWNNLLGRSVKFVTLSGTLLFICICVFCYKTIEWEVSSNNTEIRNSNSPSSDDSKPRVIFSQKGDFIYILVVLSLAFAYFLIQYQRLKRWISEHPDYAILVAKLNNRKAVYLSRETQERADFIVRRLGDRGSNLSSFVENIVRQHLEEYGEDIEKWRRL